MAVKRLLQVRPQYDDSNGALASNYRLFFYAAGSSTKQNTYNSSTGTVANSNPITLNALGEIPGEVWGTVGQTYKIGFAIAGVDDPPASFIWTEDNVAGINDATVTLDQWIAGPAPTYISATSFTLVGDQTSAFHVGRRLKTTNSGGTIYSTISASVFGALTTVTVINDSGVLDSGLSAVSYGLVAADNTSLPWQKSAVNLAGTLTPAQITANQNDYTPGSLATANQLRLSTDARRNVTGLAGGSTGRLLTVLNVGTFPAVFTYEDALSAAANRFSFGCTLGGGQCMMIQYDSTSSRWRPVGLPPDPVGGLRDFAGGTVPGGYLACDASAVSRTTYAALFNEIGTTWGTGDGSTTFNVPPPKFYIGSGTATTVETITSQTAAGNAVPVATNNTKWITGMPVTVSGASGFTGLTNGSWWIVRSAANTVQFATSLANAQNGTVATVTGTGSAVLTTTFTARTVGEIGGEEAHAMSITELLAHTHNWRAHTTGSGLYTGNNLNATLVDTGIATTSTGGNAAMNVIPIFAVVTKMIKF